MTGHLYFVGIAGHAMRGVALAARELGYTVTGLDEHAVPPGSTWLDEQSFTWYRQFEPSHLNGVTAVVVTGAGVTATTPVIVQAGQKSISVKSFAQVVGELTADAHVIGVAGTHGKTTTTSLITWLMEASGYEPDYLVGIRPFNFDTSVRLTGSKLAVIEADEYRASPLEAKSKVQYLHPDALIITNIEHDHPDFFPDTASVQARFTEVVKALPPTGRLIVWAGSKTALSVAANAPCPVITYNLTEADYTARDIAYLPAGIEFDVEAYGHTLGRVGLPMYGRHNVLNGLAAIATTLKEGVSLAQIIAAAPGFKGAYRRFNVLTTVEAGVTVIDDYAHHPTEVAATLTAAKMHYKHRRIVAVFRPHTYSRTNALMADYKTAFDSADLAYITDIEGAREAGVPHTISGQTVADTIGSKASYFDSRDGLVNELTQHAKAGDVVVCMTVSGYEGLAETLATNLNAQ